MSTPGTEENGAALYDAFSSEFLGLDREMQGDMQTLLYGDDSCRDACIANLTTQSSLLEPSVKIARTKPSSLLVDGQLNGRHLDPESLADKKSKQQKSKPMKPKDVVRAAKMAKLSDTKIGVSPTWHFSSELEMEMEAETPKRKRKTQARQRWKPTNDQLRTIDRLLNSGIGLTHPKLLKEVQVNGEPSQDQLTTWLRSKYGKQEAKKPKHEVGGSELLKSSELDKRLAEEGLNQAILEFDGIFRSVLSEIQSILSHMNESEVLSLCRAIHRARYVICHGVGREGLVMEAFVRSLNNIGIKAFRLSDTSMPQIAQDDIFLVSAGPSFYTTISALALEAKRMGTQVIAFTAHPSADLLFAQKIVRIPSQTLTPPMPLLSRKTINGAETVCFLPDSNESMLSLGGSYELGLKFALESVMYLLKCKVHFDDGDHELM